MVDQDDFLRKVIQYLNNQHDDAVKAEIKELTGQSSLNKRIYDQIVFIWNNSSDFNKLDQIDEDAAVLSLEAKLAELQNARVESHSSSSGWKKWLAAAVILLIAGAGYFKYNQRTAIKYLVKSTATAIDSITLVDGSHIYLDAFSEIKYPEKFSTDTRDISLTKGQAFFKIHRDTLHPFVVQIRRSSVTVLGTSFNIDSRGSQIALNVSTGKVKFKPLANNSDGAILHAGTGILYDEVTGNEQMITSGSQNNEYWLTHEIVFNDASLLEVCKELESFYKVKITLAGNTSAFKKFNAHFKDNKLSDVIEVLRVTYPIKIKQGNNGSIIIQNVLK